MSHSIFGIRIDDPSKEELNDLLTNWMSQNKGRVIVTPNAEFLLEAMDNESFTDLLNKSDLSVADSVSLVYASIALTDNKIRNRHQGVGLIPVICKKAAEHNKKVLFLGGDPGAADASANRIKSEIQTLTVEGFDPGVIKWNNAELDIPKQVIEYINSSKAEIVAVGLGQVKQEQFIFQIKDQCPSVKVWIGIGGAFEMISGQKKRAPRVLSKVGLEWLWRLVIEPSRWRRIFDAVIVFPLIVANQTRKNKTLIKSTKKVFSEVFRQFRIYES